VRFNFKPLLLSLLFFPACASVAVAETVPITESMWELSEKGAEISEFKGRPAIRINRGSAIIKDANFKNGIIEYDVWMEEKRGFGGVYFRKNGGNAEYFYLRPHLPGKPDSNQYVPMFNQNSAWQIFHGERYSAPINYNYSNWIHVKLMIKDDKMDVYVDSDKPVLHVANLLLDGSAGDIQFSGGIQDFHYSNISVTKTDDITLIGSEKPLKNFGPNLIRSFDVSTKPVDSARVEAKRILERALIDGQSWTRLEVGETGVANLSEVAANTKGADTLFVRLKITADSARTFPIKYGFSDRVTVFLNGHAVAYGDDRYVSATTVSWGQWAYSTLYFCHWNRGRMSLFSP